MEETREERRRGEEERRRGEEERRWRRRADLITPLCSGAEPSISTSIWVNKERQKARSAS